MTAVLEERATTHVLTAELAALERPPCESDLAHNGQTCAELADWTVTFTLLGVFRDVPPQQLLLCDRHTQDWTQHLADCRHCGSLVRLSVKPLERKAAR